jgi:hypothetical protein
MADNLGVSRLHVASLVVLFQPDSCVRANAWLGDIIADSLQKT